MSSPAENTLVQGLRAIYNRLLQGELEVRIPCATKKEATRLRFQMNQARKQSGDTSLNFVSIGVEEAVVIFRPQIGTQALQSLLSLIEAETARAPSPAVEQPAPSAEDVDVEFRGLFK